MLVVRPSLAKSNPSAVKEIFGLLRESKPAAPAGSALDAIRFGVENIRPSLELIIHDSTQQGLIPKRFEVDELFDDLTRNLS
jgi:4,5-dihydroxyphthalate decarboxylase